jgi:hypothetical protein
MTSPTVEVQSLDAPLVRRAGTEIMFLPLCPLAGG